MRPPMLGFGFECGFFHELVHDQIEIVGYEQVVFIGRRRPGGECLGRDRPGARRLSRVDRRDIGLRWFVKAVVVGEPERRSRALIVLVDGERIKA